MRCSANVLLSFIFLGILSTFADACVLNGPRHQLASDTVRWSLNLSGGETCIRGVRFNNVVVDKLTVVSAPQTGHVTLQGSGFSYRAARDFQGADFFSLMVSGATSKVPGSSTIEVEVSVTGPNGLRPSSTMTPSSQSQPSPPSVAGSPTSSPPLPPPVIDLCGPSNNIAASSAPTTNLCSTGTASVVSGNGPWRWFCTSSNGHEAAQCSAPVQTSPSVQKPGPRLARWIDHPECESIWIILRPLLKVEITPDYFIAQIIFARFDAEQLNIIVRKGPALEAKARARTKRHLREKKYTQLAAENALLGEFVSRRARVLGREKTGPRTNFMKGLSAGFVRWCGQPLDDVVGVLTEIAFGEPMTGEAARAARTRHRSTRPPK
jgi:hypothetical protein